jgi:hypothetical protein
MKYERTTIEVSGRGQFPVDMLRYDQCVVIQPGSTDGLEMRKVRLWRFSPQGKPATASRWSSFGWTVTGDSANGDLICG